MNSHNFMTKWMQGARSANKERIVIRDAVEHHSNKADTRQSGFTMGEAMISITLIGVLAALLLPVLYNNVGKDKLFNIGRSGVADLAMAYTAYSKTKLPDATTSAAAIVNSMGTVRILGLTPSTVATVDSNGVCSGQCVQVANIDTAFPPNNSGYTNSDGVYVSPCNATTPCALLQTGALLQYDANVTFGNTASTSAIRFILDTDGSGIQNAIPLALFINGRVSTVRWSKGTAVYSEAADDTPVGQDDPEFILDWTDG